MNTEFGNMPEVTSQKSCTPQATRERHRQALPFLVQLPSVGQHHEGQEEALLSRQQPALFPAWRSLQLELRHITLISNGVIPEVVHLEADPANASCGEAASHAHRRMELTAHHGIGEALQSARRGKQNNLLHAALLNPRPGENLEGQRKKQLHDELLNPVLVKNLEGQRKKQLHDELLKPVLEEHLEGQRKKQHCVLGQSFEDLHKQPLLNSAWDRTLGTSTRRRRTCTRNHHSVPEQDHEDFQETELLNPVLGQDLDDLSKKMQKDLHEKTQINSHLKDFLEDLINASNQHELCCLRSARPVRAQLRHHGVEHQLEADPRVPHK